jgi:hypothetical protein
VVVSIRSVGGRVATLAQPVYPGRFGYTPAYLLPYPDFGKCFSARSIGNISDNVLFGKEDKEMYWYNPTTRTSERVQAPSTDEQAIRMLAGTQDSAAFVNEYCELRRSGTPMEQALVLVGHEFRLKQPEYQLALRQEI